jgi:hypothetical protein
LPDTGFCEGLRSVGRAFGAAGLVSFAAGFAGGFLRACFAFVPLATLVRRLLPTPLLEGFPDRALELLLFRVAMSLRKQMRKRAQANETPNRRQAPGITAHWLF